MEKQESSLSKLLLIEDDLPLAELTQDFLLDNGFKVMHAADGQAGLIKCKENIYDLIICDVMLPDISGFKLIEKIRSIIPTPTLFLTAINEDDEQVLIYMKMDGGIMEGMTVMVVDDEEAVFVNIIGQLDPAELAKVMDSLDVDVDLDLD